MEQKINYRDVPLIIEGNYEEGEAMVMYYSDMSGSPSSPSDFEITSISVVGSGVNIFNLFSWEDLEEISELVIEKIEN